MIFDIIFIECCGLSEWDRESEKWVWVSERALHVSQPNYVLSGNYVTNSINKDCRILVENHIPTHTHTQIKTSEMMGN